jgi:hypothetical protein
MFFHISSLAKSAIAMLPVYTCPLLPAFAEDGAIVTDLSLATNRSSATEGNYPSGTTVCLFLNIIYIYIIMCISKNTHIYILYTVYIYIPYAYQRVMMCNVCAHSP